MYLNMKMTFGILFRIYKKVVPKGLLYGIENEKIGVNIAIL